MMDRRDRATEQSGVRLDSWKDIAAFFGRDVRTVRRWEADRGLPVRRVPGHARGRVFAYQAELQAWLDAAGEQALEAPESTESTGATGPAPSSEPALAAADTPAAEAVIAVSDDPRPIAPASPAGAPARRWRRWSVAIALVAVVAGAALLEGGRARPSASPRHAVSAQAENLYLRGRYALSLRTEASLNEAVGLFTQALQIDPDDAAAYAGLADCHILLRQFGNVPDMEAFSKALTANERALALDPTSVEAVRTHAFLLNYWLWDFPAADREFQRAIALDPKDVQTHHWYATSLYSAGHFRDALAEIEIARRLQPDSVAVLASHGILLAAIDPQSAREDLRQLQTTNPTFPIIHRYLGMVLFQLGQPNDAIGQMRQAAALHGDEEAVAVIDQATAALAAGGTHGERDMLRVMGDGLGRMADRYAIGPLKPAYYYGRLRDAERTMHYLTLAFDRHDADFVDSATNPVYAFLRGTPAFEALQRQRGRPPSTVARAASVRPPPLPSVGQ